MSSTDNTIARPLSLMVLLFAIYGTVEGFTASRAVAFTSAPVNSRSFTKQLPHFSTAPEEPEGVAEGVTEAVTEADAEAERGSFSFPSSSNNELSYVYEPVFDFSDPVQDAVAKFDRIDDAIMGGISTSSIRPSRDDATGESFASWSGVCRTDGGGFCGTRTLPFKDGVPLRVMGDSTSDDGDSDNSDSDSESIPRDGFYLKVRLTSDNEPERRVWKLTTRVENVSRSEQLYQAMFEIPKQNEADWDGDIAVTNDWKIIKVPFDSFVQVRGPRIVENGPPLDLTGGLYQIGMTMSKFQMATNMTEFENFRPGYFELQIQKIGVYTGVSAVSDPDAIAVTQHQTPIDTPMTLTKKEAEQKKPMALKVLFPILKLFFNEKQSRQKSAAKILKSRGMDRLAIAKFGFQRKVGAKGMIVALAQSVVELVSTAARLGVFWTLKIALFYPLVTIRRTLNKLAQPKKNNNPKIWNQKTAAE